MPYMQLAGCDAGRARLDHHVRDRPGANSQEFDLRRSINIVDEIDGFPIIGIIPERTWWAKN